MIEVYCISSTTSASSAIDWLKKYHLPVAERRITKKAPLTVEELKQMLACTNNSFDDLLRSCLKTVNTSC